MLIVAVAFGGVGLSHAIGAPLAAWFKANVGWAGSSAWTRRSSGWWCCRPRWA
jgi:hypothetical protein